MGGTNQREEVVFEAALLLPLEYRAVYLERVCASDAELRQRVEKLLQAREQITATEETPIAMKRQILAPGVSSSAAAARLWSEPLGGRGKEFPAKPAGTEKPGDHIGRYILLQEIGEGGCGVVYMAEQQEPLKRRVALKVIKPGMDTRRVLARFEAERQALALMDHQIGRASR